MMDTEGMVAMVRALPDASLTVSLLDGTRQYTLVPATGNIGNGGSSRHMQAGSSSRPVRTVATEPDHKGQAGHFIDSASQAVDGRYASVYQISHCSVRPTSPPVLLTEFPPQKPELSRGHGNFVVGGLGSGERSYEPPTKISQSYRGGMNWSDRSVYTPRSSHHYEADPFAHSLRKYPNLSPERSAEIIERLVNYTTARNSYSSTKNEPKGAVSPTRSEAVPSPRPGSDRRYYVTASLRATRLYEAEGGTKTKTADDSPSRDNEGNLDCEDPDLRRSVFQRIYDVRPVRETRKAKETLRTITAYSKCHMETQAEIPMVSKEVTTTPRERPSTCNVAVPLSPSASTLSFTSYPDSLQHHQPQKSVPDSIKEDSFSHKSIQTANITDLAIRHLRKSVQTFISSIDIHQADKMRVKSCRKIKSQEEIRGSNDIDKELLNIIKELTFHSDNKTSFCVRIGLLKKLKKIYKLDHSDRLRWKLGRCRRDHLCYRADCKHIKKDLSKELFPKVQANNIVLQCCSLEKLPAEDVQPTRNINANRYLNELIKDWLHEIPVKAVDYLGKPVKKEQVLHVAAGKIKSIIMNKVHYDRFDSLKSEILSILDDVPIEVSTRNKKRYLNRMAHDLTKNLVEVFTVNPSDRKRWEKSIDLDKTLKETVRKDAIIFNYHLPPDNELKRFVDQEIKDFTTKFNVKICPSTEEEIQIELIDILIDSFNDLRYGKEEKLKEEIVLMISEFIYISEHEGIYFANNIIYNFKHFLKEKHSDNIVTPTFVVLQNTTQNFCNQTAESPKKDVTDHDKNKNIEKYTQQIVQQINKWMENISGLKPVDAGFKRVVAYDLAGDIVDRHKYLELNSSSKSTDANELEHLKYQIFKWVNKLVGENNVEAINQASQLMDQIQNIPVPTFTKPDHNVNKSKSVSFKADEESNKGDNPNERKRSCSLGGETPESSSPNQNYPKAISFMDSENNNHEANAPTNSEKNSSYPNQTGLGIQLDAETRNVCTETDISQIPKTRPCSTSMTDMGYSKAASTASQSDQGKRYSSPPGFCLECPNARLVKDMPIPPKFDEQKSSRTRPNSDRLVSHGCNLDNPNQETKINQLKDEYDRYLQTWVQQIPIILAKPEEQGQIDTMRKRVYHGVWKAITKLQMNPNTLSNLFHYQDVLDDELEELLDTLPQSRELINKKQIMKNQLIKKTADTHVQIFNLVSGTSYKQQLVDNVATHMPRKNVGFTGFDVHNICEDIHKLNLAETFLMYTMYDRDADIVKANVFKKKLMKQIQEIFDDLKRTRGVEMADIDIKTYKDEILKGLLNVHPPSDQTIREEADEVLIGLEIEQWFQDLPLYETDNNFEILCRKRYRDSLAQKVHEMEKEGKLIYCEDKFRHEITRFMTKLPIRENEIENIPFMIEELVNRLKNRPKNRSVVAEPVHRFTNLVHPHDYDDFSRNMPHCSSFTNGASAGHAQMNESSYYIRDGEQVVGPKRQSQVQGRDTSSTSQQWYSLQEGGAHKSIEQPSPSLQNHIHDGQAQNTSAIPQQRFAADGSQKVNWQSTQSSQGLDCCRPINIVDARVQDSRNSSQRGQEDISRVNDSYVNETYCPNQKSLLTGSSKLSGMNAANCKIKCKSRYPGHTSLPTERHIASPLPKLSEGQVSDEINLSNHRDSCSSPQDQYPEDTNMFISPDAFPNNDFSGNKPIFQENVPLDSFPPAEGCLKPNENQICYRPLHRRPTGAMSGYPMNAWQGRSTDACGPETLSKPIPSTSGQSSSGMIPKDFCKQPFASSTPQNHAHATRESRTKKRSTESGRSRRETARNRDVLDSDDSVREEVKCRCIERMLRYRKKRAMNPPCDECDIEYPLCVPLRFCPYPYFY